MDVTTMSHRITELLKSSEEFVLGGSTLLILVPTGHKNCFRMKIKVQTDEGQKEIALSFSSEFPVYSPGSEHQILANLHLAAPALVEEEGDVRPPVDMVAVVDRSGSMSGSKLRLVKQTLSFIIEELDHPLDRIGVVDYGSNVNTVLPLTRLSDPGQREHALRQVNSIRPNGMTNLSGGLLAGLQMIENRADPNEISSVLLFTDGEANVGMQDAFSICNVIKGHQVARRRGAARREADTRETFQLLASTVPFQYNAGQLEPEAPTAFPPRMIPHNIHSHSEMAMPAVPHAYHSHSEMAMPPPIPAINHTSAYLSRREMIAPSVPHVPPAHYGRSEMAMPHHYRPPQPVPIQQPLQPQQRVTDPPTERNPNLVDYSSLTTVNTFGFGSDHDAEFLQKIAESGHGLYYFIENAQMIGEAFVNCLGGLMSVVAKDLEVTLSSADCEIVKVFTDYDQRRNPDGSIVIRMSDLQSEENRDLCVVLSCPRAESEEDGEDDEDGGILTSQLFGANLRYLNPLTHTTLSKDIVGIVARIDMGPSDMPPLSVEIDEVRNRLLCSNALLTANALATRGLWPNARNVCTQAIAILSASPSFHSSPFVANLIQDLNDAKQKLVPQTYYQGGQAAVMNAWTGHAHQRVANFAQPSQMAYSNVKRGHLRAKLARRRH